MNRLLRKTLLTVGLYDTATSVKYWIQGTQKKYQQFYSQFIAKNDLCFDIGANVGRRVEVMLRLGARVVAAEPVPYCVKVLRRKFGNNSNVTVVDRAVGDEKGQKEMMICDAHSLSSLSEDWVHGVSDSGRYAQNVWDKQVEVEMVTLDELIAQYGKPQFVKIDVEGYEDKVMNGLSQPLRYMCFEYTPELLGVAERSIKRLADLGTAQFNYTTGRNPFAFVSSDWMKADDMLGIFSGIKGGEDVGDIFSHSTDL
jgi:FkbM family methyltransferase